MNESQLKINDKITSLIQSVADFMGIDCQVQTEDFSSESANSVLISISTQDGARYLIGKSGQNLKALEHIIRIVASKIDNQTKNIVLDVNDYKKSRSSYVVGIARDVVARVRSTQKAEMLIPMTSFERKVVHMELASCSDIITESVGLEPHRRILIKPYP